MKNSDIAKPRSLETREEERSLEERLRLRDAFFRNNFEPQQLLQPFEHIPGILYFVKDAECRLMAVSRESVRRMGYQTEEEILGKRPHEYLPEDLADVYLAEDQWVIQTGQPILNRVVIWFNEQGARDWIVTNKYPLRNASGEMAGIVGTIQSFEARRKLVAHLGPVGKAVDYIRDHLGEKLLLPTIAAHAGFSERQLQRHFRRVFSMSVQKFIIQSRIHSAIHELTHSNRSIAEIALMFGFSDQSAFSNKFREMTGFTPRKYRERHVSKFTS